MTKEKYIEKECKKHGLGKYVLENRGWYKCVSCRSEAVQRRRTKLKQMAIQHKGGRCICCGYNKSVRALTFHHTDPAKKNLVLEQKV